ncbi:unnamed protein product [Musa acuminata subsp. malaccensis]|uniref:(wild Malaysian banana) hypothetical protein n=1 Tax=Musa acuminata subsp. malaccensis TaxID=214687 RepID=A0A804JAF8_MUSAM|nr:unnamed protein product [Musa acuminata subsp. malaccensis]
MLYIYRERDRETEKNKNKNKKKAGEGRDNIEHGASVPAHGGVGTVLASLGGCIHRHRPGSRLQSATRCVL